MKHLHHYRAMMKSGGKVKTKFESIKDTLEDLLLDVEDKFSNRPTTSVWYYPDKGGYEFRFRIDGEHQLISCLHELDRIDEYMESMGFYFRGSSFGPKHTPFSDWIKYVGYVGRTYLNQTDLFYTNVKRR